MLQQILKEATKINHDELEQLMFVSGIMDGTLSIQQYQQILTTNYIVHKAFEARLLENLSPELASQLDIAHRQKLSALTADLHEAGMETPEATVNGITFENNDAAILGAMYVMEGATLGGNVIVKRLQINPKLNSINLNFNYYQVYGSNLIPYWKTFCEILNKQPKSAYDTALKSAQMMFKTIAQVQLQNNKLAV